MADASGQLRYRLSFEADSQYFGSVSDFRGESHRTGRPRRLSPGALMIRIFLFVVAAGLVLMTIGVVMLGTFPPTPQPHQVEKIVPNDKFTAH
jgi:hypothetical protein